MGAENYNMTHIMRLAMHQYQYHCPILSIIGIVSQVKFQRGLCSHSHEVCEEVIKLDAKPVKHGIDQLCLLAELPRPPTVRVDMRNLVEILVKILKGPPRPPTISTKTTIKTTTTHS